MKFGANLRASPFPSHIQQISVSGASTPGITDWSTVPPLIDPLGNDQYGNCCYVAKWTWARIKYASRYNRVAPIARSDVLRDYGHTGFDPATGTHDDGTDPNEMMGTWARDPNQLIFESENWPIVWATVQPTAEVELAAALEHGPLLMMIEAPEDELDDPDTWCDPPGGGVKPLAAHEMLLLRNGPMWRVASWGRYYDWHPARASQVFRLDAALEASRVDLARLGLDFDKTMTA